jgi:hypothetical protein
MNIKIYLKLMIFATIMALIYTHMQMRIVELAYKGKEKEREVHDLIDSNGMLTHEILTLKSVNNLGNKLLDEKNELQFMSRDRVMAMQIPVVASRQRPQMLKQKQENPFINLLSFLGIREAKAWE